MKKGFSGASLIKGNGEMASLIRSKDWSQTAVGEISKWPASLITTINIILNSRFPMFLWWGNDLIQFYNDAYSPSFGKEGRHPGALGQKAIDCWHDTWHVIHPLIQNVLATGEPYLSNNEMVPIYRNGKTEDAYWTFSYSAVYNDDGNRCGVLVNSIEITDAVIAKKALQESEIKFRGIVEQSPVPIMVTRGAEMIIEEFNEPMLHLIRHDASIRGKTIYEAMPELKGQAIIDRLNHCFLNGEIWTGYEQPILLVKDHVEVYGYYNVTYQPYMEDGIIAGVLHSAIDVTEQVVARKEMEKTEDTLKLSLLAANLGTFDLDLENNILNWDKRCRTLFGINHDNEVSYEIDFVGGLHPDDRDRIVDIIENQVFNKAISNGNYDVEYRTVGAETKKIRWVRAMGKTYFDENDKPVRFLGSVLDITEQKEDELRKNDFIGMVSHELKTPLTSLKGYMQVLQTNNYEKYAPVLLPKIEVQVNKMNTLINGFLNISRFESGKLILNKQEFDIDTLVDEIIADKRIIAPNHNITFEKCCATNVLADKEKIESVIRNLLSNAIKYSPVNTEINVTCTANEKTVEVRITDHGIGIKEEDLDNIFQRYYRVEDNFTKTISGFGIGLYLSAEIIKRHGGTIGAESIPGKGSSFYFTLAIQ